MNRRTVRIGAGLAVLFDGDRVQIVEFDARSVTVRDADGSYRGIGLAEFAARAASLEPVDTLEADPGLVLAGLSKKEKTALTTRARHVREVLTGYASGHPDPARPDEPLPAYAPGVKLGDRYAAKAAELGVGLRTIEYWAAAYKDGGEAGLADDRVLRRGEVKVDARWDAALRAEMAAVVEESTPTRAALIEGAVQRLAAEYGEGVVPLPSQASAYRRLKQLAKGTNAVSGSAKGRRSIAERPGGVYGRLRATRPGEYLILDTQDLDVFAMEPVTCRWVRAQLTVAQDLFDRQIVGMKVTPVSTKAIDVAGVLFEAVTGISSGRPGLGPLHGVPDHLVFDEADGAAATVWCPPETLVIDNGRAFLSSHVIGVCARLGISVQPAQPYKPTDKPTVERFFRTLRERLIGRLPGYKGPDLNSRGVGVEEKAFYFLDELEDVVRDWVVTDYHRAAHGGLALAEWPRMELSPNEMHEIGVARAGVMRLPASPELALEFLQVGWRTIQHYGIDLNGLCYNGSGLEGYRNVRSTYGGVEAGKWPIRFNPDDVRYAYFQDPGDLSWHRLDWEHAPLVDLPFSREAADYARRLAVVSGRGIDRRQALAEVLERWSKGQVTDRRERRMAARLSAQNAVIAAALAASPAPLELAVGPSALRGPALAGDDDEYDDLGGLDFDLDGFYDDALEVLE